MTSLLFGLGWSLIVLLFAGCGKDAPVIARVGDAVITAPELQRFVDRLPAGLRSEKEGRAADLDHLESMVDQELLLQEARIRGVDTSRVVSRKLEQLVRQRLVSRYQTRVIAPRVEVAPAEIERAFTEKGFNRERLFSRMLVVTTKEVEEVQQQLREGEPFEALARRFAANDLFAQEDGEVGWIGRSQLQQFGISGQTFFSLPEGQVAEPVQLPGCWQIFRFLADREADETKLADYWEEIRRLLEEEQWAARNQEEFEVLGRAYGLRLHPEGMRLLLRRRTPQSVRPLDLSPDEAAQQLYSFSGGEVTVEDYLASLESVRFQGVLQDSSQIVELARRVLLPSRLFAQAARRQNWDQEPEFTEWHARKNKELILRTLMEEKVAEGLVFTEKEIREFYQENPTLFRNPEQVTIREVWAATEEEASELREAVERGTEILELLRQPGVHSHGNQQNGEMRLRDLFRAAYPELVDAALAARQGELVGPVYVETLGSHVVFRVLNREGADTQPFEQARRRAEALVRKRRKDELVAQFIRHLREKYKDQVEVFADRLG